MSRRERLRAFAARLGGAAAGHAWDVIALAGLAMVFAGLWWVCPAAAMVVVGASLVAAGLCGARAQRPGPTKDEA